MSPEARDTQAGPSAFSVYASRFLSGKAGNDAPARGRTMEGSQIFRAPSPSSPSHDPFLPSPSASQSNPYLPGSSRSPSPSRTPPYPGSGLAGIPDIDAEADMPGSHIGVGLLFDGPNDMSSAPSLKRKSSETTRPISAPRRVPNPYAPSSSESEDDIEPGLDEVESIRRSLRHPQRRQPPNTSDRSKKGWLAHQSVFPPSSSSSSETDESDKQTEDESDVEAEERSRMMGRSRAVKSKGGKGRVSQARHRSEEADDELEGYALSASEVRRANIGGKRDPPPEDLEEPLLGPDEMDENGRMTRVPVRLQVYHGRFAHWEREGLRKYKDSGFLALWLSSVLAVLIGLLFVWGSTESPSGAPSRSPPSIIPILPLLLVLLIPALVLPPAFILLLRHSVRPILLATAVSIPISLFVCGWWAFGASFETSGLDGIDQSDRWWSSSGMRIGAVLLWLLAALFGRLVYVRRKRLERTAAVVELSTELLLSHPPLLLLSPLLLAIFAITSIPFLTLLIRLGTIGYWRHPKEGTYVFHLRPYAGWLIFLVTLIWVWTWGVIRGIGRVAVAGVIGEWYFHREEPHHPPALEITTAALHRATGTSLGSICLGSGIVAVVRVIGRSAAELKRVTSPKSKILPSPLVFLTRLAPVFGVIAGVLDQMNGYALVYVGITGEGFWPSARRAVGLAGKRKGGRLLDYTLIKLLLTLSSTAMGMFTATAGYLYMTHSLSNPSYAPVAALLCGGVPFLAIRAGASVLGDAADSLFICHQIDRELGGHNCDKAKEAFEGVTPRGAAAA